MSKCKICNDTQRVQLVPHTKGLTLWLDCPACTDYKTLRNKILNFIMENGHHKSAYHKQWLIDQLVRIATRYPEEYMEWVASYKAGAKGVREPNEWYKGHTP